MVRLFPSCLTKIILFNTEKRIQMNGKISARILLLKLLTMKAFFKKNKHHGTKIFTCHPTSEFKGPVVQQMLDEIGGEFKGTPTEGYTYYYPLRAPLQQ